MSNTQFLLLATHSSKHLEQSLSAYPIIRQTEYTHSNYDDGEPRITFHTSVAGQHVVIIGSTAEDRDLMDLVRFGYTAYQYKARSITIIIPYYGGSTKDRADRGRQDCITAKVHAEVLSVIPSAPLGNRVILMDCHTEGIPQYFPSPLVGDQWSCSPVILELIKEATHGHDSVLVSADSGRASWVASYADELGGIPTTVALKVRLGPGQTRVTQVNGDIRGRWFVLYDDIMRSGGTAFSTFSCLMQMGAIGGSVVVTHGDLCGQVLERARSVSGLSRIYCTDTHPIAWRAAQNPSYADIISVRSVSGIIARNLESVADVLY